ncbi:YjzD family protein [Virgibacillus sp. FSP13]
MRFIWTFVWALLISCVISYILTSMASAPFNFMHALILAIIFTVAILLLGEGILKGEQEEHEYS